MARHVGPRLERVGLRDAGVEPVGPTPRRREHERPRAALAELRLVPARGVLVVVGGERVEEQRHPPAARRPRLLRHIQRVRLQLADEPPDALRPGAEARGEVEAHLRRIEPLAELVVAREDPVDRPGLRHSGVVVRPCGELREVHIGVELAHVAEPEGVRLVPLAPPPCGRGGGHGGVAEGRARWVGRVRIRLAEARPDVHDRGA